MNGPQPKDPHMEAPSIQYFESEEAFRVEMNKDPSLLFAAIKFSEYGDGHLNYTIFMNGTLIPIEYSRTVPKDFSSGYASLSNSTLYSTSGFLAIQQAIDEIIIKMGIDHDLKTQIRDLSSDSSSILHDNNDTDEIKINTRMQFLPGFPKPGMEQIIPIFVSSIQTISSVPFIAICIIHLVNESTSKTREYLFMLGLKKSVYWVSWFVTFIIPALIIAVFGTFFNYAYSIFSGGLFTIFSFFLIFEISCILFSFLASSFVHSSM